MKTLFFMLKTAVIVALTGWILQYNGFVTIQLEDHIIRLSCAESCLSGLFFAFLFFATGYGTFFLTTGRRYRKALKKYQRFESAIDFLTKSLAALMIKQGNSAQEWGQKARKILGNTDIVVYLEAQAAYIQGEKTIATNFFKQLITSSYPMFGIVPLLDHNLLESQDTIPLLQQLGEKYAQEPWILELFFTEMLKSKNAKEAQKIFLKMKKLGVNSDILNQWEPQLLLIQREQALQEGQREKAWQLSEKSYAHFPKNEATVLVYIHDLCNQRQQHKALEVLSKQWQENPTIELVQLFKEITLNMMEEEKTQWKNHLLNSTHDAVIKNLLVNN